MVFEDITWSLSGVDARRWDIQEASLWRPPVSVRASLLQVPGRHGVIAPALPVFEEPTVALEMAVAAESQADVEAASMELVGLLAAPGLVAGRSSGGLVVDAPARLVSISPGEFLAGRFARFQVVLALPGVFLRGAVATTPTTVLSSQGQQVEATVLAGSTGPCGDAVLRVTGPASSVSVVDVVSGTGLSWSGTALIAGRYLYLDAATLKAWWSTSSSNWAGPGTDVTSGLDYPAPGPLQLWPRMQGTNPADRRARVTVTGTGWTAATALAMRARPAYL